MKLNYDQETDSLYIDLNARPSVDSREIQDGIVIDLDTNGRIVGIDIQRLRTFRRCHCRNAFPPRFYKASLNDGTAVLPGFVFARI
jgi:uncharacterized protein YuzE